MCSLEGSQVCHCWEYHAINIILADPGILPREYPPELEDDVKPIFQLVYSSTTLQIPPRTIKRTKRNIQLNGAILVIFTSILLFPCSTCRPPTVSHCSVCNNCVESFDHHCAYFSHFFPFIFQLVEYVCGTSKHQLFPSHSSHNVLTPTCPFWTSPLSILMDYFSTAFICTALLRTLVQVFNYYYHLMS